MLARVLMYLGPAAILTYVFAEPGELGQPARLFQRFLVYLVVGLCIAVPAELMAYFGRPRLAPAQAPFWRRLLFWTGVVVISTFLGGELAVRLIHLWLGAPLESLRGSILRVGLAVCAVVVAVTVGYERLREQARATELAAEKARQAALRAELAALQARTNPHFLFNSLNSVAALIDEDPALAEKAVLELSRVFRYALDGSRRPHVALDEELAAVRSYLSVEALRFGDRLRVSYEIAPDTAAHPVAPLLLQPLVENAVLHGVAGRRDGGTIAISARRAGDELVLAVSSPLPDAPTPGGSGTALADLRARLALTHGDRARLDAGPAGGDFQATLHLPWEAA
jgi:two-component system sensor histidine kinase AlgZ